MMEPEKGEMKETVVVVVVGDIGEGEEDGGEVFDMIVDERGMKEEVMGRGEWRWSIRRIEVNAGNEIGLVSTGFGV
jgi:hypothetical protein